MLVEPRDGRYGVVPRGMLVEPQDGRYVVVPRGMLVEPQDGRLLELAVAPRGKLAVVRDVYVVVPRG